MDSINKRLEMLEGLKPRKGSAPHELDARFAAMSDDAVETITVVIEAIQYGAPSGSWWCPTEGTVEAPSGYMARQLGLVDRKLTEAEITALGSVCVNFIDGEPPPTDEQFVDKVKQILKGA